MKFYLLDQIKSTFKYQVSSQSHQHPALSKCINSVPYDQLNLQIGFPYFQKVEAGKDFVSIIEVDAPKSIVSIMF